MKKDYISCKQHAWTSFTKSASSAATDVYKRKHTDTQTYTHTHRHTHTDTDTHTDTHTHTHTAVSYTNPRAHETGRNLVCPLLLEKKNPI